MGKRGEGWVLLQGLVLGVIVFAPRLLKGHIPQPRFPTWLRGLGAEAFVAGNFMAFRGMRALDRSLTVFPKPVERGSLVVSGPYAYVRHPIYSGLILGVLGWGLFGANLLRLALTGLLFLFFDVKSRQEERWLSQAYDGYSSYQRRVKKLIPWVY